MIDKLNEIYNMLEDEQSKSIFINRINYLITHDRKYINKIVAEYVQDLKIRSNELYVDIENTAPENNVIIWGCGKYVREHRQYLSEIKKLKCYCDSNESFKKTGFYGYEVITPKELLNNYKDAIVVIGTSNYYDEISRYLKDNGFVSSRIFFLGNYVGMCSARQYFDEDIIKYEDKEIFVDCGAYDLFNTRLMYSKSNLVKSYAFEPDKHNYKVCGDIIKNNCLDYVELLPCATWSNKDRLCFCANGQANAGISEFEGQNIVEANAIDNIIPRNNKVTFIKMDVEGAELRSLQGATETIKKWRPKLAICIYHKPEDMYEIPLYIKEIVPEYKFYIRHYSNTCNETVLYAVID